MGVGSFARAALNSLTEENKLARVILAPGCTHATSVGTCAGAVASMRAIGGVVFADLSSETMSERGISGFIVVSGARAHYA